MKRALILLIITAVSLCCAEKKADQNPQYNLLVIVSDALRADALSCHGGDAETPNICRLAAEGVLFEKAYSNSSWTLPSSVAMFTGAYPDVFSKGIKWEPEKDKESLSFVVGDQKVLLAEAMKEKGYDVYYDIENRLSARSNTMQGFSDYRQNEYYAAKPRWFWKKALQADFSSDIAGLDVPLLHYLMSTENTFFFVKWILDPHSVYSPSEKFKTKIKVDLTKLTRDKTFYEKIGVDRKENLANLVDIGPTFNEHELGYVKDLYLKEIESVDERLGQILMILDKKNLREKTIIVFTSDHGESFGEQGRFLHGGAYYEERVHVPLIISGPGIVKGKRVSGPVSHIDLMPTLKDLLMVDCLHSAQGESFKSVLVDEKAILEDREIYFTLGGINSHRIKDGLRLLNYKLLILQENNIRLFDLADDPDELHDLSKKKMHLVRELETKIKAIRKENKRRNQKNMKNLDQETVHKITQKTREQLKALGYIK